MKIENKTILTRRLMIKFNYANLFYKMRFNIIIFPIMMLVIGIYTLLLDNVEMNSIAIAIIVVAVLVPILLILVNTILLFSKLNKDNTIAAQVHTTFAEEGFFINSYESNNIVAYNYIKECKEFNAFYILYFIGAEPMLIDKMGFSANQRYPFNTFMKEKLKKRMKAK